MTIALSMIKAVVRDNISPTTIASENIKADKLSGHEKIAFEFILQFYQEHGVYPSIETVEIECNLQNNAIVDCIDEPFKFWADQVCDRWTIGIVTSLRDRLGDSSSSELLDLISETQSLLSEDRLRTVVKDMSELHREVMEKHDKIQQNEESLGISFGIPFIDGVSGGIQKGDVVVLAGMTGLGKCHPKDTKILMYDGSIQNVQDIRVGELVMGDDSTQREVVDTVIGYGSIYRIIPVNGDVWECNADHILSLKDDRGAIKEAVVKDIIGTKELMMSMLYRVGVDFPEKRVLHPYTVGSYLAKYRIYTIPSRYLINSRENRLQLLAGIIDVDGSLIDDCYEITYREEEFSDHVVYLCRSLGFAAYKNKSIRKITSTDCVADYFRLVISGQISEIPVKVPHNKADVQKQIKNILHTRFHIEYSREDSFYGFVLKESPLYLLGDFTVTHNTSVTLKIGRDAYTDGNKVLAVCTEMPELQIARRDLAMATRLDSNLFKMGEVSEFLRPKISEAIDNRVIKYGEEVDNYYKILPGGMYSTIEDISTAVKELKPDLLIVDGAAIIRSKKDKGNRWEGMINIVEAFKHLAMVENIGILLTYHFGKDGTGKVTGIYGGQAMTQFASILLSFEYENPADANNTSPVQYRILRLLKGRDGEKGSVRMLFNMKDSIIEQDVVLSGLHNETVGDVIDDPTPYDEI